MQKILALAILACAALYLFRRFKITFSKRTQGGCGGGGCGCKPAK